jgi:hypothetical protein
MPRRKPKYPDKPYVPSEDARRRIAVLMEPEKAKEMKLIDKWAPKGGWQLWRWDDLTDVLFD